MNPDPELSDLEHDLKQLRPAPIPQALRDRIAARIGAEPVIAARPSGGRFSRRVVSISFGVLSAAAAITILLSLTDWPSKSPAPDPESMSPNMEILSHSPRRDGGVSITNAPVIAQAQEQTPNRAERYLIGVHAEGLVYSEGHAPFRRFRTEFVDAIQLSGADDPVSVRMFVPRDEWMYVPVAVY